MSKNTVILKNTSYLIFRTLILSVIGLFTVREVLRLLGAEDYGLFNLVFGVATLFTFINGAMIASSQRYLAYYIGKKDQEKLNEVWSNILFLHLLIGIIVCSSLFFSKDFILNELLFINLGYKEASYFIFNLAIVSVFITIIQSPFNALILAKEKMSFYAQISLLNGVIKLLIVYILYLLLDPLLVKYALLYVFSSLITCIIYILYCWKKLNQNTMFKIEDVSLLKEIFFYSSWNIFGNFSSVAKLQGFNILLNIFFGLVANTAYALTNTLVGVINGLVSSITTAINPQIHKTYAENNYKRNILLINMGSKYSFFFCLIVVLPIFFNTKYLLKLWLSDIPLYLSDFIQLSLIFLLIETLSTTLMTAVQATGKVKIYQILLSILILLNLPLSYFALKVYENILILYWIQILISLICLVVRLIFLNKILKFNINYYVKNVIVRVVLVLFLSILMTYIFMNFLRCENDFLYFMCLSAAIVSFVVFNIFVFGLSKFERVYFYEKLNIKMKGK
ncbi:MULTISPECIES: oligosaccharide flippase family protein [unclassified Acinetobacter]|uniref:oligosaccharide flippase family protein n=1 Tax=unclassified Acinetobacter TaxID=196816 RepID=UPI0015D2954B|nr:MULTISPECIES: oligosaccharide flippase family protein [unclassified Acinetobacter]